MPTSSFARHLEAHGVADPALLALAEAAAPGPLFPHQDYILGCDHFAQRDGLLILSPTGTGKTLLALGAILRVVAERRVAVYLVPSRALAREKSEELRALLGPAGYRVACSSREERLEDAAIASGAVDVAVIVYEKAISLLLHSPWLRRQVGLVVADECQIVDDPQRGAVIGTMLRLWRQSAPGCWMMALAASIQSPGDLCRALNLFLIRNEQRIVPQRRAVYDREQRELHWEDGTIERVGDGIEHDDEAALSEALLRLCEALPRPLLLFVPTRRLARELAATFAERSRFRVALHSLDCTRGERVTTEASIRRGDIDICVATTTLAEGVNLRAASAVFLDGGSPEINARMESCLGRVARPGAEDGCAVIVPLQRWSGEVTGRGVYTTSETERLQQDLQCVALALAMEESLTAEALDAIFPDDMGLTRPLRSVLLRGAQNAFWQQTESVYTPLPAGVVLAEGAAEWESLLTWRTILRRFHGDTSELALVFLATGAGLRSEVPLLPDERLDGRWVKELRDRLRHESSGLARYFEEHLYETDHLARRIHSGAKAALLWFAARSESDPHRLAPLFGLTPGIVEELLDYIAQAIHALCRLAEQQGYAGALPPLTVTERDQPLPPIIDVAPAHPQRLLVIRRGTTGLVTYCGRELQLTRIQFRLLELLARHAGDGIPYDRVERYVWPDAVVERQQVAFHRKRLDGKLREAGGESEPLIETHAAWGIRLRLEKEQIRFEEQPEALLRAPSARIIPLLFQDSSRITLATVQRTLKVFALYAPQPQQTHRRADPPIHRPHYHAGDVRSAPAENPHHYRCGG